MDKAIRQATDEHWQEFCKKHNIDLSGVMGRKRYLAFLQEHHITAIDKLLSYDLAYEITTKHCRSCPAYSDCRNEDCFYFRAYGQIKQK